MTAPTDPRPAMVLEHRAAWDRWQEAKDACVADRYRSLVLIRARMEALDAFNAIDKALQAYDDARSIAVVRRQHVRREGC